MWNPHCGYCDKSFTTKLSLRIHTSNLHVDNETFKCLTCEKEFNSKDKLNRHKKNHKTSREFNCHICDNGFAYKWKRELDTHIKIIHENVRYKCDFCQGQFKSKSYLRLHKRNVHENRRTFKCDTCDLAFKDKKHLNAHVKSLHQRTYLIKCNNYEKEWIETSPKCRA